MKKCGFNAWLKAAMRIYRSKNIECEIYRACRGSFSRIMKVTIDYRIKGSKGSTIHRIYGKDW